MRLSQLLFVTLREDPSEAEIPSHKLLVRAGYIRRIGNGLYSYLPFMWRVLQKVSQIDSEDGQTWRTHVHSGVDKHFQVLFTQPDKRRGNDFAQKHKYWRISDPFLLSVLGKEIWEWKHTTGEGTDSPSDSKLQSSNTNTNTSNAIPWQKRNCPSRMLRHGIRSDAKWKFATLTIKKKTM